MLELRDFSGFDMYAERPDLWFDGLSGNTTIVEDAGRDGGGGLTGADAGAGAAFARKNLTLDMATQSRILVGFAFRKPSGSFVESMLVAFTQGDSLSGSTGMFLRINADGTLELLRGNASAGATVTPLVVGTWYYVELAIRIGSSQPFELRVNETTVLTGAVPSSPNSANAVRFGGVDATIVFDDVYLRSSPNEDWTPFDWMGDVRITNRLPSAAGNATNFTPLTGPNNFAEVNEAQFDGDDSYVHTDQPDVLDLYQYQALAGAGAIRAVAQRLGATSGTTDLELVGVARVGGTNYEGNPMVVDPAAYRYVTQLWEQNPDTGGVWTQAGVNNSEFGPKTVAGS